MVDSPSVSRASGRVALLGAHTAVAQSVVECCDDRDLALDWTRATTSAHVGPGMILIDPAVLDAHGLFVVAFDDPIVPALLRGLEHHGVSVIDLSGRSDDLDVPTTFAGLGPPPAWPAWARIPCGPAHPVVSLVAALAPLGLSRVDLVTWESAAEADQAGIEELSEQTRAVFTMQDREPRVFPAPLAFNALGADPRWENALRESLEASKLEVEWGVTRLRGPSFSVDTVVVQAELADSIEPDAVKDHLEAGRAIRVVEGPFSALEVSGRDDLRVHGVRVDGRRLRLVASYDRLRRGSATQAAWLVQSWKERAPK